MYAAIATPDHMTPQAKADRARQWHEMQEWLASHEETTQCECTCTNHGSSK